MSQVRLARPDDPPDLYRRIRFDRSLEDTALRRLTDLDLEGCRLALGRLLEGLDLRVPSHERRSVVLLLLDVLQRINRRVNGAASADRARHAHRAVLLELFGTCDDAEEARRLFMPALNRLLASVGPGGVPGNSPVQRARTFIEENYHRRLSLSAVASRLHVSPNYLSRIFRKEIGTTLTAYIHQVRLDHAMMLLAAGDRSISEIAYSVGYQNYRDFYRNFVKQKRLSPRQARRRLVRGAALPGSRD